MSKYFLFLVTERTSYDRDGHMLEFDTKEDALARLKDLNTIADYDYEGELFSELDSLEAIKEEIPTFYESYKATWERRFPNEEMIYDKDVLFEELPSYMTCSDDGMLKYVYSSHLIKGESLPTK